jgi:hypothetical protein
LGIEDKGSCYKIIFKKWKEDNVINAAFHLKGCHHPVMGGRWTQNWMMTASDEQFG